MPVNGAKDLGEQAIVANDYAYCFISYLRLLNIVNKVAPTTASW